VNYADSTTTNVNAMTPWPPITCLPRLAVSRAQWLDNLERD
jgi:hypothetical protein